MNKYFFLFLLIFTFGSSNDSSAQTQTEMNAIANNDFKKADAELNKVYKELMKDLNEKERKLLIAAQKNWLNFRDSHCKFEVIEYEGGSIQPLIYATCLTDCTNKRIEDLKSSIENRKH